MIERDTPLIQSVGIGLAGRGSLSEVVGWAAEAQAAGLDSIWFHDTPYERDGVTYATAVASHVHEIRVAVGALSPFTRHPAVIAQTVSALDDLAPGRVILGLGTGLPLRLGQMGVPYSPASAVERVSEAMDLLRALWSGTRVPAAAPGLPPIEPMFPPVHRVPIFIAAYRSAFMELAGQKADGYLSRPAESIPNLRRLLARMRAAATTAGREPDAIEVAGYLLTHIAPTRREALNRAKREPFVIYMISVQSDLSFQRAGFDPALRLRIAAAWREGDYHAAAQIIPDELVNAFLLCGAHDDVVAQLWAYREAGMNLPLVQPILQESEQVRAAIAAAADYGRAQQPAPSAQRPAAPAEVSVPAEALDAPPPLEGELHPRWQQRAAAWIEIARPFSLTASSIPVLTGGALAAIAGAFSWPLFLAAFFSGVLLQVGTNVVNEIYDVRKGIDTITSPRASRALLKGVLGEREAFVVAAGAFIIATALGLALIAARGLPILLLGLLGLIGGWGYTAPPLQYKYRAYGLPLVFLLMGPLMVVGATYAVSGLWTTDALVASIPVGLLVTAILHGNEWRDIGDDARAGIRTFSIAAGRGPAHAAYVALVTGAYMVLAAVVAVGILPPLSLLPMLSLPLLVRVLQAAELGATGQQRAIAMIDLQTAQLHAVFGSLFALGLAGAALAR